MLGVILLLLLLHHLRKPERTVHHRQLFECSCGYLWAFFRFVIVRDHGKTKTRVGNTIRKMI